MILQSHKINYAIEKSLEMISNANSYQIDKTYTSLPIEIKFQIKKSNPVNPYSLIDYTILIFIKDNKVIKFKICHGAESLTIESDSSINSNLELLYKASMSKISDLEGKKFLKIFPEYSPIDDRDLKIEEILNQKSDVPITDRKWKWNIFNFLK